MITVSADPDFAARESWQEHAACASYPAEMFFPPADDPGASRAAKAVCATCPVREECFTFALETAQSEGVWGGMDAGERRRLRRRTRDRERRRAS
jgi:WhiB family redox-sensing transcriptional regulator